MKDYQSIRRDLLGMLQDLDEGLEQMIEPAAPVTEDLVEPDLSAVARGEIEKLKQTIAQVKNGQAGICLLCGENITPQRLARLPFAHYCARCAGSSD